MSEADGWVIIATELDTTDLKGELRKSKKELEKYKNEAEELLKRKEELEVSLKIDEDSYNEYQKELKKINDYYEKIRKANQELGKPMYVVDDSYDIQQLNQKYPNIGQYEETKKQIHDINRELEIIVAKQVEEKNNQDKIVQKLREEKNEYKSMDKEIMKLTSRAGREVSRLGKKITNIGLAFIGIRSVYGFFSSSMSLLSRYNEQLAKDIEYIKFALATTLEPIITKLVQLVYKLLSYLGYIMQAWFGINIFARASADAMNKTNKSAKDLKKQLAGFDEMNVLSDTSGAENSSVMPSMDLSQQNVNPPKWLVWIGKNGKKIISLITGIATALALLRLGLSPLMAGGIGIAVAGVVYAVVSLLDYLKDPTWENFGKVITGIGIIIAGVAIAFGAWPVAVAGALMAVLGIIFKYRDQIKTFFENVITWLEDKSQYIRDNWGQQIGAVYDTIVSTIKNTLVDINNFINGVKLVFDGLINFIKGVFTGDWKLAWQGLGQIVTGIFDMLISKISMMLGIIKGTVIVIAQNIGFIISDLFKWIINQIINRIEYLLNTPINAINGIIRAGRKLGIDVNYVSTFRLPRLAKGGIINMPGRGVNYGGANIGERGSEGIIPLTDSQQMALLGEAIGKFVTINANIPIEMNGRVLSREIKKINAESDFAYNR